MKVLTDSGLTTFWNKIKSYVSGNIYNPDNEDISSYTSSGSKILRLADRTYNASNFSGKGYKILRKNIKTVNNVKKNVLEQSMINSVNTIYEIRYDFDLNGATITIPSGCTLTFEGGSLSNGTVEGNSTTVKSNLNQIFSDMTLNGTYNSVAYPEWFKSINDIFTKTTFTNILFTGSYEVNEVISIKRDNINISGGATLIVNSSIAFSLESCENVVISGLRFVAGKNIAKTAIFCKVVNNLTVERCSCSNINLIASASGTNDVYATTTVSNSNNYFNILNNNGTNTNSALKEQAIRLIFVNNFIVAGNNFDGYFDGMLAWGGDCLYVCRDLSGERKCKDGLVTNNNFTNCISAGIWTACAQRITIDGNIVTSKSGREALDAEGSVDISFSNNKTRGFESAFTLFGNIGNINFCNNDVVLNDTDGYILQTEPKGIENLWQKNGEVTLRNNKVVSNIAKYFNFSGKGITCENNIIYNAIDNVGTFGGYAMFKNNMFIYNVAQNDKKGLLRTMILKEISDVPQNYCKFINNKFLNIGAVPLVSIIMVAAQENKDAVVDISRNSFVNINDTIRFYSDSSVEYTLNFCNNIFSNSTTYPISSNVDLPKTIFRWKDNSFVNGKDINADIFVDSTIKSYYQNVYVSADSQINTLKNDGGSFVGSLIAISKGKMTDISIYKKNILQ